MAEWREKGYVPDSDDEDDESQPLRTERLFPPAVPHSILANTVTQVQSSNPETRAPLSTENIGGGAEPYVRPPDNASDRSTQRNKQDGGNQNVQSLGRVLQGTEQPLRSSVDLLQSQLLSGIQAVNEFLGGHFQPSGSSSINSSPLSSIQSSLSDPISTTSPVSNNIHAEVPAQLLGLDVQEDHDEPSDIVLPNGRTLRHRNPIQQNPYTLEAAKYQQSLRARGLRPVRLLTSARDEGRFGENIGVQEPPSSQDEALDSQQSPLHRTTSSKKNNVSTGDHEANAPRGTFDDPNGSDLNGMPQLVRKRRKLIHPKYLRDSSFRRDYDTIFDFPAEDKPLYTPSPDDDGRGGVDDMSSETTKRTPTTPLAHTRDIFVSEDGFRYPRGMSPPGADPLQRTEQPLPMHSPIQIDDSSEEDEQDLRGPPSSSPVSGSEANEDDSQGVLKLQRRIKGVLPASWLRLDRVKQIQSSTRRSHTSSRLPQEISETKGVALKTSKPQNRLPDMSPWYENLLSDDDEDHSSKSSPAHAQVVHLYQPELGHDDLDNDNDDIVEEDDIDAMVAKSPRSRARSGNIGVHCRATSSALRQFGQSGHVTEKKSRNASKAQRRITEHAKPLTKQPPHQRPSPSFVSILDADDFAERSNAQQPDFLKIAARQARSRRDFGRRKPEHKVIQLESRKETHEANQVLQRWKDGRLARAKPRKLRRETSFSRRPPLQERPSNAQVDTTVRDEALPHSVRALHPTERLILKGLEQEQAPRFGPNGTTQQTPIYVEDDLREREKSAGTSGQRRRYGAGNLISRLQQNRTMRDAQVESEKVGSSRRTRPNHFTAALASLNRQSSHEGSTYHANSPEPEHVQGNTSLAKRTSPPARAKHAEMPTRSRQLRKQTPKRRLPSYSDTIFGHFPIHERQTSIKWFKGEAPSYPMDFSLSPFSGDVHLGEKTFLGNSRLSRYLGLTPSDGGMDNEDPRSLEDICLEGGPAMQIVLKHFSRFRNVNPPLCHQNSLVNSLIADRTNDSDSATSVVESLLEVVCNDSSRLLPTETYQSIPASVFKAATEAKDCILSLADLTRLSIRLAVFAHRGYALCLRQHSNITIEAVTEAYEKVLIFLASLVLQDTQLTSLHAQFLHILHHGVTLIDDPDHVELEAIIVLHHLLDTAPLPSRWFSFWDLYNDCVAGGDAGSRDLKSLETKWRNIFTVSLAMSFSVQGQVDAAQKMHSTGANWTCVKDLLSHGLGQASFNLGGSKTQSPPFYLRAVYQRCFVLVQKFHWSEGEAILDVLYDLFRRQNFECPIEEHYAYPDFLDNLTQNTVVEIQKKDSSFLCLLKLIAVVAKEMTMQSEHNPQAERRLKNLLFRLVPNNGHTSSKYEEIEESKLTPLKNHHDLLTTLYWCSPIQHRPRLQRFQDLVDFSESHLGACRVSLKAWTRLAVFQISTLEPLSSISSLVGLLSSMVLAMVKQHRAAAQEVQAYRSSWPDAHVESVVMYNKGQIESFLCEVVGALDLLVRNCRDDSQAIHLLQQEVLSPVIGLFPTRSTQCDQLFVQIFKLVESMVQRDVKDTAVSESVLGPENGASQHPNEDSQEFGDWSHLEALMDQPSLEALYHVKSSLFPVLFRLVGDVMGTDVAPESNTIEEILDSWSTIIQALTAHSLHHAGNFVAAHHRESWFWLRNTPQKRRYYPLFATQLIAKVGPSFYQENRAQILESYVKALCELETFHTWLPQLTCSILAQNEALIQTKLPVSLAGAQPSRILSVVMLNIRATRTSSGLDTISRDLVVAMLASMKTNYKELDGSADRWTRDKYVVFVHHVLSELSIYLPGYRKLEPFFNDSTVFPLTASSIYISLRQYSLTLTNGSTQKPLATFIYNILERAALEDNQGILQDQLIAALNDLQTDTAGLDNSPIRFQVLLLQSLFPAYVETMCSEHGRYLVLPVLATIQHIYRHAIPDVTNLSVNGSVMSEVYRPMQTQQWRDAGNVRSFLESTRALLASFQQALRSLASDRTILDRNPHAVEDLYLLITTISTLLRPINMLQRVGGVASSPSTGDILYTVFRCLSWFDICFANIEGLAMQEHANECLSDILSEPWQDSSIRSDPIYTFARSDLTATFASSWSIVPGQGMHVIKPSGPRALLSAKRRDKELRKEIEQTGVEWAKWTIWSACKIWRDEWQKMDGVDQGRAGVDRTGDRLKAGVMDEDLRLFVL